MHRDRVEPFTTLPVTIRMRVLENLHLHILRHLLFKNRFYLRELIKETEMDFADSAYHPTIDALLDLGSQIEYKNPFPVHKGSTWEKVEELTHDAKLLARALINDLITDKTLKASMDIPDKVVTVQSSFYVEKEP